MHTHTHRRQYRVLQYPGSQTTQNNHNKRIPCAVAVGRCYLPLDSSAGALARLLVCCRRRARAYMPPPSLPTVPQLSCGEAAVVGGGRLEFIGRKQGHAVDPSFGPSCENAGDSSHTHTSPPFLVLCWWRQMTYQPMGCLPVLRLVSLTLHVRGRDQSGDSSLFSRISSVVAVGRKRSRLLQQPFIIPHMCVSPEFLSCCGVLLS